MSQQAKENLLRSVDVPEENCLVREVDVKNDSAIRVNPRDQFQGHSAGKKKLIDWLMENAFQ